jgi:hypothetical protein
MQRPPIPTTLESLAPQGSGISAFPGLGRITLTGADERTSLTGLVRLTEQFPCAEIGLLYTFDPEGRPRYPSVDWLKQAVAALGKRCAVHVCGSRARTAALQPFDAYWISQAGRVQVNGPLGAWEAAQYCELYGGVITQHHPAKNPDLSQAEISGHSLLLDASGGRGLSPAAWLPPQTNKPVGFAGGLGLDNLAVELPRIVAVARPGWWVDMEDKLRDAEDWFSLDLARMTAEAFLATRQRLSQELWGGAL